MSRKGLEDYFKSFPMILEENIAHRFRKYEQFNTVSLANHLEIKSKNTNLAPSQAVYMQPHNRGNHYVDRKFQECISNESKLFVCVQSLDLATPEDQNKVLKAMQSILDLD